MNFHHPEQDDAVSTEKLADDEVDESKHSNGREGDKPWNDTDLLEEEEVSRLEEDNHLDDELEWNDED